jgi:phenol 2-monooxygenase
LHPEQSPYGIRAWDTIFADDETYHLGHGHAYRGYGVDPNAEVGCMVLCRPDQYVAAILPITDVDTLNSYLEGVLIPQRK